MSCYNQCGYCKNTTKPGHRELTKEKACIMFGYITFMDNTSDCFKFEKWED